MSKCTPMQRPTIESVKRRLFVDDDDDASLDRQSKRARCHDTQTFNGGSAPLGVNAFTTAIDAQMANCSLITTAEPANQSNFATAPTMHAANSSFIINQPFAIHYTGPAAIQPIQPVLPQFYFYLPTQLNSIENQYLLINTMDPIPSSRNMQVSSLYDGTMAFQTTNAYTYNRQLFEHFNISYNDTL